MSKLRAEKEAEALKWLTRESFLVAVVNLLVVILMVVILLVVILMIVILLVVILLVVIWMVFMVALVVRGVVGGVEHGVAANTYVDDDENVEVMKSEQKCPRGRCTTVPVRSSRPPQVTDINTQKIWRKNLQI